MPTASPFAGVINDWRITAANSVYGTFVTGQHPKAPYNGVLPGHWILTSLVVSIKKEDGYSLLETKNSRYILIGEPGK